MHPPAPRRPRGRPSKFVPELADRVIEHLIENGNLEASCMAHGVKPSTFRNWIINDLGGLAERYQRARAVHAMILLDECQEIADDSRNDWLPGPNGPVLNYEHIRRCEARINYRMWEASKWLLPHLGGALATGYAFINVKHLHDVVGTSPSRTADENTQPAVTKAGSVPQIGQQSNEENLIDSMAGGLGFEPRQAESESAVLPLDDPPEPARAGIDAQRTVQVPGI